MDRAVHSLVLEHEADPCAILAVTAIRVPKGRTMPQAVFRFYGDLNDFLPYAQRQRSFTHCFEGRVSVKDMIESLGVPHPEVALILAHGAPVTFDYLVPDGVRLAVYPLFRARDVVPRELLLIPPLPDPPCFVLDIHLGRLAAYLRMLGFDTLFPENYDDEHLARIAHDEQRVLLTRDQGLLKRKIVVFGYWVRATYPRRQLREVVRRFELADRVEPFKRCANCNGVLQPVDKTAVMHRLHPDTLRYYDSFRICPDCGRIYWKGSHYARMERIIADAIRKDGRGAG